MNDPQAKENPEALALRAKPKPVMRLNRRSLMVLIGGAGAVGLGACLWAFRAREPSVPGAGTDLRSPTSVTRAEGLDKLPHDYDGWRPILKLGPAAGELGRPILREEQLAGIEPGSATLRPNPEDDAARVARLRLQEEAEAAAKAQVFFQISHTGRETPIDTGVVPTPTDLASAVSGVHPPDAASDRADLDQLHKKDFVDHGSDAKTYSTGKLQTPRSPYELMAGTVIAAALVTGINSDLPGQMVATVTQNVYDTVTGNFLLIPQGSRMIGQYDSQVAYGQRRVLLVWTRVIMPDGSSITLDRLQGVDAAGYSGLEDQVDSHWGRLFAGAAISTLLGVNSQLVARGEDGNSGSVTVAIRQSSQDSLNQVGQQITRRNLNIQPTITIRPGFPVRIMVNRDLVLRPYATTHTTESGT